MLSLFAGRSHFTVILQSTVHDMYCGLTFSLNLMSDICFQQNVTIEELKQQTDSPQLQLFWGNSA